MKYLYLVLLLLPLKVLGQVKLQDVTINGKQPKFVRLKGYFRSYQHNDSLLKYYEDGIVEYYINLKNEKVYLGSAELISSHRQRVADVDPHSDDNDEKPPDFGQDKIKFPQELHHVFDELAHIPSQVPS